MKFLICFILFLCIIPNQLFSMLDYPDETSPKSYKNRNSSSQLLNGSEERLPTEFLADFASLIGDDAKKFLDRPLPLPATGTIREYLAYQRCKDSYEHKTESEYKNTISTYVPNFLLEDDQFCEHMFTKLLQHKNNSMYSDVQIFFENKILEKIRNDNVGLKWQWLDCITSGCLGLNCCVVTGMGIRLLLKNYSKLGYSALILGALGTLMTLPIITKAGAQVFFANKRIQLYTDWIETLKNNEESTTVVYHITNQPSFNKTQ
jgi:hypothetical protein